MKKTIWLYTIDPLQPREARTLFLKRRQRHGGTLSAARGATS